MTVGKDHEAFVSDGSAKSQNLIREVDALYMLLVQVAHENAIF